MILYSLLINIAITHFLNPWYTGYIISSIRNEVIL